MAFAGFQPAAFAFLRGLAAHQTKAWFEANRPVYERELRLPLSALVSDVAARFEVEGVPLTGDAKRSLFRINRDVRFSKDKSPYKANAAAVWFRPGGVGKPGAGVVYFHLADAGCFMAAAFYHPDADLLGSFREGIRMRPDAFLAVVHVLQQAGLSLDQAERLSRMPRGFEDMADTPLAPFLRLRNFVVQRPLSEPEVSVAALAQTVADFAKEAMPLLQFGWRAVDEVAQG